MYYSFNAIFFAHILSFKIYPQNLSAKSIRKIYPQNLSAKSIRKIYPQNLSAKSIRKIYPQNLSAKSIRKFYPQFLSAKSIRNPYPHFPPDPKTKHFEFTAHRAHGSAHTNVFALENQSERELLIMILAGLQWSALVSICQNDMM